MREDRRLAMRDELLPERMKAENDFSTSDLAEAARNRAHAASSSSRSAAASAPARSSLITPAPESTGMAAGRESAATTMAAPIAVPVTTNEPHDQQQEDRERGP